MSADDETLPLDPRPASVTVQPLALIAETAGTTTDAPAVAVTGLTLISQDVRPGDLYAGVPGTRTHGARFAPQAAAQGAVAVLTDAAGASLVEEAGVGLPVLVVDDVRAVLGDVAAQTYGRPSERLTTIGITGTQGKTTSAYLASAALRGAGLRVGTIGTTGTTLEGREVASSLTTPEAPSLHALFAQMLAHDADAVVMEVSSHALALRRVDGIVYDVAVFLNLGRDHLDFHADVEDYFAAKASLFEPSRARRAVVVVDDPYGRRLVDQTPLPTTTVSIDGRDADWRATDLELAADGSRATVVGPRGQVHELRVAIPGRFNVSNALAVVAAATDAGYDVDAVLAGIAGCTGIPGRMERVDAGQDFAAIVDYAHKPDALEAVLGSLRPLAADRLVVVIGAGGDRDPGKRPLMGEVAARLADVVVVTDDNPRTEDPATIREAVLAGARDAIGAGASADVVEVGDRRAAIVRAVAEARPGDVVVVAGKGHETGQLVDGVVHPFDDRVVLREAIAERVGGAQ